MEAQRAQDKIIQLLRKVSQLKLSANIYGPKHIIMHVTIKSLASTLPNNYVVKIFVKILTEEGSAHECSDPLFAIILQVKFQGTLYILFARD